MKSTTETYVQSARSTQIASKVKRDRTENNRTQTHTHTHDERNLYSTYSHILATHSLHRASSFCCEFWPREVFDVLVVIVWEMLLIFVFEKCQINCIIYVHTQASKQASKQINQTRAHCCEFEIAFWCSYKTSVAIYH